MRRWTCMLCVAGLNGRSGLCGECSHNGVGVVVLSAGSAVQVLVLVPFLKMNALLPCLARYERTRTVALLQGNATGMQFGGAFPRFSWVHVYAPATETLRRGLAARAERCGYSLQPLNVVSAVDVMGAAASLRATPALDHLREGDVALWVGDAFMHA